MSFSFPANPSVGDRSSQNGRTYEWSGYVWRIASTVAGHAATHGASGSDPVTITASQVSDFATAVVAASPPNARIAAFTARDNQPPASGFATLDTRNSQLVLTFDAATQESAVFVGVVPQNCTVTSGIVARLWWMGATATSGDVRWGVAFEKGGTDVDSDSFDTAVQATGTANATSGIETLTTITATTVDSLAAGDRFRLRVTRIADDATNDTMTGDAQLVAVELRAA